MSFVLVDSSVWIRHFKSGDPTLIELLNAGRVVTHEFIIEELLLGGLDERQPHYHLMALLKRYTKVSHQEVSEFIKVHARKKRFKIGLVDSYLICSAMLHDLRIYTGDTGLSKAASILGLAP